MSAEDNSLTTALVSTAFDVADRAVVCDVENECFRLVRPAGEPPVYDISPMFDTREHNPVFVDMASQGIAYGIARGLFELLPEPPMRVRLLRRPTMLYPAPGTH